MDLLQVIQKDTLSRTKSTNYMNCFHLKLKLGALREIWAVKTCTTLQTPRYIILSFQFDRHTNDPTMLDQIHTTNIRLTLNGGY